MNPGIAKVGQRVRTVREFKAYPEVKVGSEATIIEVVAQHPGAEDDSLLIHPADWHSPLPWSYTGIEDGDFVIWDANDDFVGNVDEEAFGPVAPHKVVFDLNKANAELIVNTVNASGKKGPLCLPCCASDVELLEG